jgi:hypothetical protein
MPGLVEILSAQFEVHHTRSLSLLEKLPDERIFWKPLPEVSDVETYSSGELLVRSAAAVEQAFGGITRRLWDDPFEWTLPEYLNGKRALFDYFTEVRSTRIEGFAFLKEESDLYRLIPAPDELAPILTVLLETLGRALHLQGRAYGAAQQFVLLRPFLR